MRDDRGFSLIEVLAVVAVIGVVGAISVPAFTNIVEGIRLGSSARELERQLQDGRLKAVSTNRRIRVRTNCPVVGQYRMVQVFGTTTTVDSRDVGLSRCSETTYPYNASNQNPVTKVQDGPVRRLYQGVTVGTVSIEFTGDGQAYSVDTAGARSIITTPVTITVTKGVNTKGISVNALGKIQLQ
jgi:prepilin-type N-terminal cleavage/methylation domain-containing protein